MTFEELVSIHPRLWHMATDGSWPSIRQHGLLSTSALLDLYGYEGEARRVIESTRRPQSIPIVSDGLPGATVRDQKPMSDGALEKCLLDGLTPEDWYRTLNDNCFFWLSQKRLRRLLGARAYRNDPQLVLTIETASLVNEYKDSILLSPINSGSTIWNPVKRGRSTFLPIAEYPFAEWKAKRGKANAVVELVVTGGAPNIANHVVAVHRVEQTVPTELWRRPGSSPDDGP
ncbi:hypothetical protein [Methylobacterium sp. WL6]|uniref:DUF7002 family protein n=1 Tax=Methylobacterium sp. WL6 TaxID=2603901 RepID=UPI0011C8745C|nr:hypothetical protein [Methylobacterium sp. WL6]TXN72844.1 hypothetical protein FV230_03465 [Methylobacterium sp. WL6]